MKKMILASLLLLASSMTLFSAPRIPASLAKWQDGNKIGWALFDQMYSDVRGEDWRDKFPAVAAKADEEVADMLWNRILKAKAAFHQDNLWILTLGNDSLAAAMIDVEWAFDGVFVLYVAPVPGKNKEMKIAAKGFDEAKFKDIYNKCVGMKIKALLEVKNWKYQPQSESVRFADAIKKWCIFNTVKWNDSDSLVEACPDSYFKRMGRGHQRADVRSVWCRVQNSIRDFHHSTQWLRDKGDAKTNKALDDFESALLSYFKKYAKEPYVVEADMTLFAAEIPMAVDILCMEYVSATKEKKK